MFIFKRKKEPLVSTEFSDFIRNGKSKEKKKIFAAAIKESIAEQKKVILLAEKHST
jgi:uncharacterized FlgJ-related protein